ncbi:MAG: helix-turn-helix domain-containing protein, partial [Steroidobacteraceae bacterium]
YVLTFAADTLLDGEAAAHAGALLGPFEQPRLLALEAGDGCVARIGALLERLHAEFRQPEGAQAPVCGWLACSALWIIGRELARRRALAPQTRRQHRWFTEFRALLEAHYLEHWPVARYARALGLTESRLNRLCEHQSGRSAFALAQERLALEARRRLIYIAVPVAQLARELGFRDPAYFSRFFRRHAGVPPDRYRRQHGAA